MAAQQVPVHHVKEKPLLNKLLILGFILLSSALETNAQNSFESTWSEILKEHVTTGEKDKVPLNLVNYTNIAKDNRFGQIVKSLGSFDPQTLGTQNAKLAFWINVYNIAAVKMVLDFYPVKSIRDVGSMFSPVWKKEAIVINGKDYSLEFIEHKILRKMGGPRIHFAIICASVSCPDLMNTAFDADKLDSQLDNQAAHFIKNEQKGFKLKDDKTIYISSIFKWFKEDFGGEKGIKTFLGKYAEKDLTNFAVKYFKYNWNLNDTKGQ